MDLGKRDFIPTYNANFYRKDLFEDLTNLDIPIWFLLYLMTDY